MKFENLKIQCKQQHELNKTLLLLLLLLLKNCLHSAHMTFETAFQVSFSGEVEMMCQVNLKASIVKLYQIMNTPPTAAAFKADRTGSTIVIKSK